MTHNLTIYDFCSSECYICVSFNNVSPISVIDLHQIIKIKEYKNGELVYGDLDLYGRCVMKYQNMNNNKSIHKSLYDFQKIPKEKHVDENIF